MLRQVTESFPLVVMDSASTVALGSSNIFTNVPSVLKVVPKICTSNRSGTGGTRSAAQMRILVCNCPDCRYVSKLLSIVSLYKFVITAASGHWEAAHAEVT